MSYRILVTEEISPLGIDLLLDNGYDVKMGTGIAEEILLREIEDCDAVLTRNAVINENVMRASERLKVIAMHGVGVNTIDVDTATRLGIQVLNTPDSNKVSVAEFTIGLILDLAKHIVHYDHELRGGNWNIRKLSGIDVEGKTLGIIGMGNIGSLVAKKATMGLGMKVIAHKRNLLDAKPMENVVYTDNLHEVMAKADFVSLHVPLTSHTKNLIGKRELALMKPKAYLINTARGEVIQRDALYDVLANHKIAGAALDVFHGEVPDANDPLLALENVIVTPHAAAFTQQSVAKMALHAAMGVHEVLSGQSPTWPVNRIACVSNVC